MGRRPFAILVLSPVVTGGLAAPMLSHPTPVLGACSGLSLGGGLIGVLLPGRLMTPFQAVPQVLLDDSVRRE